MRLLAVLSTAAALVAPPARVARGRTCALAAERGHERRRRPALGAAAAAASLAALLPAAAHAADRAAMAAPLDSTFLQSTSLVFLSEIGDKTFFIAAILSMRHSRLIVWAGAVGALAVGRERLVEVAHEVRAPLVAGGVRLPVDVLGAVLGVLIVVYGNAVCHDEEHAAGSEHGLAQSEEVVPVSIGHTLGRDGEGVELEPAQPSRFPLGHVQPAVAGGEAPSYDEAKRARSGASIAEQYRARYEAWNNGKPQPALRAVNLHAKFLPAARARPRTALLTAALALRQRGGCRLSYEAPSLRSLQQYCSANEPCAGEI